MDFKKLSERFADKDLEWRIQSGGVKNGKPWAIVVPYVDARAVMNRLDEVAGPENWKDEYEHLLGGDGKVMGVKCTISVWVEGAEDEGGAWISKQDGAEETDIEAFKGGFSKAFVRAAVKWGIGRYLYDIPQSFATFVEAGRGGRYVKFKDHKEALYWTPPLLEKKKDPRQPPPEQETKTSAPKSNEIPRACITCGKDLKLSRSKMYWFCPNFEDESNGKHTQVKSDRAIAKAKEGLQNANRQ